MTSLWLANADRTQDDPWEPGAVCEDVVVGAGLTGLLTGLLVARAGRRVAIVEARSAGAVTTGNTTAKLSLLQGTHLSSIRRYHGSSVVKSYVEGNREGQAWLLRYCEDHGIPHQFRSAYSYANTNRGASRLRQELALAHEAGLDVSWVDEPHEVPFPIKGAITLPDQVQFDPMDVVNTIAAEFRTEGGRLHTGVRATGLDVDERCTLQTDAGALHADRVVVATGMPFLDRGLYFAKLEPQRSYVVSYTGVDAPPQGMYLSVDAPSRSLRTAPRDDGTEQLLVGGGGHVVGRTRSEQRNLDEVRRWAEKYFPEAEETHWWSAQDYIPIDSVPPVGALPGGRGRVFVGTGYSKWGMTNAAAAALQLASEMLGSPKSWAKPMDHRITGPTAIAKAAKNNAAVGMQMAAGWAEALLRARPGPDGDGSGATGRDGAKIVARSNVDGVACSVTGVCTHLGGVLKWNDAEKSWDCPLHGSRFSAEGRLLEGPATADLQRLGP